MDYIGLNPCLERLSRVSTRSCQPAFFRLIPAGNLMQMKYFLRALITLAHLAFRSGEYINIILED